MLNFSIRLLNYPGERLLEPRQRLKGIEVPDYVKAILPLKETPVSDVGEESDFILLIDYFVFSAGFDNASDFKEFVAGNSLYQGLVDSSEETKIKINHSLKYVFSVKRILQGIAADDTAYSFHLPYLTEAVSDLECSFALVEMGYFKQSLQTLRNVLEETLFHAYYAFQGKNYGYLEESVERMPNFKSMIKSLRVENLFTDKMEQELFSIYKDLSGAVHSEVTKLNITRSFTYKSAFSEWYNYFVKVANLHIMTIIRMIEVGI